MFKRKIIKQINVGITISLNVFLQLKCSHDCQSLNTYCHSPVDFQLLITILSCLLGLKYSIQSGGSPVDPLSPLEFHSHLARALRHIPMKRNLQISHVNKHYFLVEEYEPFLLYFFIRLNGLHFSV